MIKKFLIISVLSLNGISIQVDAEGYAEKESRLSPGSYQLKNDDFIPEASAKSLVDSGAPFGGTSIRYITYAASAMNNLDRGTYEKDYFGTGCIDDSQDAAAGMSIEAAVDIPHNSKIVSVSFLGYDATDSSSFSGTLWAFTDGAAASVTSGISGTSFNGGYVSVGSYLDYDFLSPTTSLTARLSGAATNGLTRLCGVRIGFVPPSVADDVVFVNNFYR